MTSARRQARLLEAADKDARHQWPTEHELLAKRSEQLGYAKGLLADVIAAAEAPEDIRGHLMNYAVARIRRELGENGRLSK